MRRIIVLSFLLPLFVLGAHLVAAQRAPGSCTQIGTSGPDTMRGGDGDDVLCALRGNDFLHGAGGADILRAGRGRDTVVGAEGRDILRGGRGPDELFAVDNRGGERVVGGKGKDQCFADEGDQVIGCEQVFLGLSLPLVRNLERSLYDVIGLVEVIPTISPPPPIPTVTETITVTVPFPPCTPAPGSLPPPCA